MRTPYLPQNPEGIGRTYNGAGIHTDKIISKNKKWEKKIRTM